MRYSRIIIVGCGPAGMACAMQLKRMGLEPLVIEKVQPGGMLVNANLIENYPGFPDGISGQELSQRMVRQIQHFNVQIQQDEIILADYSNDIFRLNGRSGLYHCSILVAATGTRPEIPESCPKEIIDQGFAHFDISLLRHLKGKTIGIIGAGDAAFDYGLTLSENGNKVFIFNRGDKVKALKALSEKVFINNQICYLENHALNSLEVIDNKELLVIFDRVSGNSEYSLDYLIFATGRKPDNGFFGESLKGELHSLIKEHRLYLLGDLKNGNYRQVSVAVGDGIKAAMEIFQHESNQ